MPDRLPGSILFVGTQNCIRSPLAERLAKAHLGKSAFIQSGGVMTGDRDPFVDVVLTEIGIDPGIHRPKSFDDLEDSFFDLIIALSPEGEAAARDHWRDTPAEIEFWPIADPSDQRGATRDQTLDAYRAVRDDLRARIQARFAL